MSTLERAIAIAAASHNGQINKAGQPYVLHPMRVMLNVTGYDARIVAALHDVIEKCPRWTLDRLRQEGFSEAIVAGVESVTRREGEDDEVFLLRAAVNPLGRTVKLADVMDNRDMVELAPPSVEKTEQLAKYDWAFAKLSDGG